MATLKQLMQACAKRKAERVASGETSEVDSRQAVRDLVLRIVFADEARSKLSITRESAAGNGLQTLGRETSAALLASRRPMELERRTTNLIDPYAMNFGPSHVPAQEDWPKMPVFSDPLAPVVDELRKGNRNAKRDRAASRRLSAAVEAQTAQMAALERRNEVLLDALIKSVDALKAKGLNPPDSVVRALESANGTRSKRTSGDVLHESLEWAEEVPISRLVEAAKKLFEPAGRACSEASVRRALMDGGVRPIRFGVYPGKASAKALAALQRKPSKRTTTLRPSKSI